MRVFRIYFFPLIVSLLFSESADSQAGIWTWISGDTTWNSTGTYGVRGVPSPNNAPASRYACGNWTDTAGNFWVYSGLNAPDDLWKYDVQTLQWTWMTGQRPGTGVTTEVIAAGKGIYHPQNSPGQLSYGMLSWLTPDNHLWLFGGLITYPSLLMNHDLWQYNPTINQWAWMGTFGPANYGTKGVGTISTKPGGRQEGNCAFTDNSGNLWLFGGCDVNYKSYNDVWKYDVASGIWTWMSGSKVAEDAGQYGVLGQPWTENYPSARSVNFYWKDTTGNFWISGGTNYTKNVMYQDAWKFNPVTLDWTWVNGIEGEDLSSYGSNCVFDSLNKIGPRYENRATWKNCEDLIITYNGFNDWTDTGYTVNDIWGYKISTDRWIKINSWSSGGTYGVKGIGSPANHPPSRIGGVGFTGKDNGLFLFGGQYLTGTGVYFNDLWKYVIDTTCVSCRRQCSLAPPFISAERDTFCANDSVNVCAPTGYSTYEWNVGGTSSCVSARQAGNYYVTVTSSNGCSAESNRFALSVFPVPSVAISKQGDTLSSFGAVAYQWYFNGSPIMNATSTTYIAKESGTYGLAITDTNGCNASSNPIDVTTGINEPEDERVTIFPNPNSISVWQLLAGNSTLGAKLEVYDGNGRLVWKSEIKGKKSEIKLDVASGIYWLHISTPNLKTIRKMVRF